MRAAVPPGRRLRHWENRDVLRLKVESVSSHQAIRKGVWRGRFVPKLDRGLHQRSQPRPSRLRRRRARAQAFGSNDIRERGGNSQAVEERRIRDQTSGRSSGRQSRMRGMGTVGRVREEFGLHDEQVQTLLLNDQN